MGREVTEKPDEWRIDVSRGLGLLEVRSRVGKSIGYVWSTDHSTNEEVWVRIWAEEIARAFLAPYTSWMSRDRRNRAATVVNPTWKPFTVPNHVRHSHRVVSQNVIHLFMCHRQKIKQSSPKRLYVFWFGPISKTAIFFFWFGPKCEKNFGTIILPDAWRLDGGETGRQLIRHKAQPFWHGSDN